jgi:hypothetical protein
MIVVFHQAVGELFATSVPVRLSQGFEKSLLVLEVPLRGLKHSGRAA